MIADLHHVELRGDVAVECDDARVDRTIPAIAHRTEWSRDDRNDALAPADAISARRLEYRVSRWQDRRVRWGREHVIVREQDHVLVTTVVHHGSPGTRAAERRADLAAATHGTVRRVIDVQEPGFTNLDHVCPDLGVVGDENLRHPFIGAECIERQLARDVRHDGGLTGRDALRSTRARADRDDVRAPQQRVGVQSRGGSKLW